jgi:hypothetical protein
VGGDPRERATPPRSVQPIEAVRLGRQPEERGRAGRPGLARALDGRAERVAEADEPR